MPIFKKKSKGKARKTVQYEGLTIKLDRPKGFVQKSVGKDGKPWERTYTCDYGFLPKTQGGDNEAVDVFIGDDRSHNHDAYWITQKNDDGSFDEYKVMLAFPTRAAAVACYKSHIPAKFMGPVVSISVEMMKAMLGIHPTEKVASILGFLDEMHHLLGRV